MIYDTKTKGCYSNTNNSLNIKFNKKCSKYQTYLTFDCAPDINFNEDFKSIPRDMYFTGISFFINGNTENFSYHLENCTVFDRYIERDILFIHLEFEEYVHLVGHNYVKSLIRKERLKELIK
jgi:hypothetical protein